MKDKPVYAFDKLYLGRHAEDLSDLVERQSAEVFRQAGLIVPVKSCSLLAAVAADGPATIADLAQALGRSHQLVQQKLPKLVTLGLVSRTQGVADRRSVLIAITPDGLHQLDLLAALQPQFERIYAELEREVGPVIAMLRDANAALQARSIAARMG